MYSIAATGLFSSGPATMTAGITDLELVETAAGVRLISTTRAGGGVMVLSTGDRMALVDSAALAFSPALPGPGRIDLLPLGGADLLCLGGGSDDRVWGYGLTAAGELGAMVALAGSPEGAIAASAGLMLGGQRLVFHALAGGGGIVGSVVTADGSLSGTGHLALSGEVSALAVAQLDEVSFLLALSGSGNAVQSFQIGAHGALVQCATLDAAGGFGVASPSAIEVVTLGSSTLALVASAGTSSISVVKLAADGTMRVVDHVIDTLDTRFQGICALETVELGGRVYVIAGGGDGGLTLMQMMTDGRLLAVAQFGDGAGEVVGPISALTARVVGGRIEIYAAGEGSGIFRFSVDPGELAAPQTGGSGGDRLIGTGGGDYLDGREGDDRLEGGEGGDILRDGAGKDTLIGGAGADVFVLDADGISDLVNDFEIGIDQIDLTAWGRVYSLEALNIRTTPTGAVLSFGTEYLTIRSPMMTPIDSWRFTVADFIGLWHLPHVPEPGRRIPGSALAEAQSGGGGDDVLVGSAGADRLDGGDGFDTVDYGRGRIGLRVDLEAGPGQKGLAAGDRLTSIEALRGGRGNDHFFGAAADNLLAGNGGRDRLSGRDGDDVLDGGRGGDWLFGGVGGDTLSGGKGRDSLGYGSSHTGVGVDLEAGRGWGGLAQGDVLAGIERVFGSGHDDSLRGSGAADWLFGGNGGDDLAGRAGADVLVGGGGADRLAGATGNDHLTGGGGADEFLFALGGGQDRIRDFSQAEGDVLLLDRALVPGGMTAATVLDSYGSVEGADLVLHLPGGETVILQQGAGLQGSAWLVLTG